MEIKDALVRAQQQSGWSDEAIADAAGTTAASVQRWKIGQTVPRGDSLLSLQKKLPGFHALLFAEAA